MNTLLAAGSAALIALALLASTPGQALAQADTPEARRAAAQELIRTMDQLTGPERMMGSMKAAMQGPVVQQIRGATHLSTAQQDRAAEVMVGEVTAAVTDMMKEMMPSMYAAMTDVYVERFSLPEIRAVQAFYASGAGRKSVTVMMDDMPRLMQPLMQNLQAQVPRLQQRMEAAAQRLAAEGIVLPAAQR